MSIVSIEVEDMSNYLCKRFATLASSYFDHPDDARTGAAKVPLENLFRVLEMFRNDTFLDENRKGVLALESPSSLTIRDSLGSTWHQQIQVAVNSSISVSFGQDTSKEDAASELQESLRQLVQKGTPSADDVAMTRAKKFFTELSVAL